MLNPLEGFINAHFPPGIPGRTPPEAAVLNLQPIGIIMNHADRIKQLYASKSGHLSWCALNIGNPEQGLSCDCFGELWGVPETMNPQPLIKRGRKSSAPCMRCGAYDVYVIQDSWYDADYTIDCHTCGDHYRADGPDA